ncbi:MAG: L,D-transpeptidase, partial [Eubacteriales bacterium]|nr:L,D-transpeptidase [Eubacteriales bacterium]
MSRNVQRFATLLLALLLAAPAALAAGEKNTKHLPVGSIEGYQTGADWFGDDVKYDITDEAACWELLMRPITVLDVNERETIYPLDAPGGKKVLNEWQGGFINGQLSAVHVLGEDEDGYTLVEGMDYYNRIIRGYVKTKLLKERTPSDKYGIIVDKLTQRLYLFVDGKLWSSCAVSTGKINSEQPYNETSAGEFLTGSWVGGFGEEGGMQCDMAIRYNGGDMIHQVPYLPLADGSKRFTTYEALLGQKASHGCIRVARIANEDGLCQQWLWDHLKKGVKVVIWDDKGRLMGYPEDSLELYYNPNGGQYYHSEANC